MTIWDTKTYDELIETGNYVSLLRDSEAFLDDAVVDRKYGIFRWQSQWNQNRMHNNQHFCRVKDNIEKMANICASFW